MREINQNWINKKLDRLCIMQASADKIKALFLGKEQLKANHNKNSKLSCLNLQLVPSHASHSSFPVPLASSITQLVSQGNSSSKITCPGFQFSASYTPIEAFRFGI